MRIELATKNYCDVIFKDDQKHDLLLILPGGGYAYTSEREAMPVANAFMSLDIHSAIFYYRETKLLYPDIMEEAFTLLTELKEHPQIGNIMVIGFSAGGHYAAMMLTKLSQFFSKGLLIYPVISTLPDYVHRGSYEMLLGKKFTDEDISEVSADLQVHSEVPPIFMMHCMDDGTVPVENTINMTNALRSKGIYVETHLYPTGGHGISIDTEEVVYEDYDKKEFMKEFGYIASWVELAKNFISRDIK